MNVQHYLYLILLLIPAFAGATSAPAATEQSKQKNSAAKKKKLKKQEESKQSEDKENIQHPVNQLGESPAVMYVLYLQLADLYLKQSGEAQNAEEKERLRKLSVSFYEKAASSESQSVKDVSLFSIARIYAKQAAIAQTKEEREKAQRKTIELYEKIRSSEIADVKNWVLIGALDIYLNGEEGIRNYRKAFRLAGELESGSINAGGKWLGRMRLAQMGCLGQGLQDYSRKTSLFALLLAAEQRDSMPARLLARSYAAALNALDTAEGMVIEADFHMEVLQSTTASLEARTLAELVSAYKEAVTTIEIDTFRNALRTMHELIAYAVPVPVKLLGKLLILKADKIGSEPVINQQMREMVITGQMERDITCGLSCDVQRQYIDDIVAENSIHFLHKLGLAMKEKI